MKGLPLVVVELGFSVAEFEEYVEKKRVAGSNHILLCSVSGWVHHFGKKWS